MKLKFTFSTILIFNLLSLNSNSQFNQNFDNETTSSLLTNGYQLNNSTLIGSTNKSVAMSITGNGLGLLYTWKTISINLTGLGNGNVDVIIENITATGLDNVTSPFDPLSGPLPVHLISFQGNINKNNKVTLQWKVADNQTVSHFEVQRSSNGRDFTTIGTVLATDKSAVENYMFYETVNSTDKVMYRLRMIDEQQGASISKILVFQNKSANNSTQVKIFKNPVNDKLTFSFASSSTQQVDVKVYDMTGRLQLNQKITSYEGSNMVSLPLSSTFKPGFYVVEVNDGTERQISKFVKQ